MKYEMYIFVPGEVEEKVDSELEEDRLVVAVLGDGNPLGGVGVAHGRVHQPALLAEDDVEQVPVLALPSSPPQGHFCLLVLTVPVSLGILRYVNPEGNFLSVGRLFENCFHLQ